jgi:uracil-DNA glycosylase family 4
VLSAILVLRIRQSIKCQKCIKGYIASFDIKTSEKTTTKVSSRTTLVYVCRIMNDLPSSPSQYSTLELLRWYKHAGIDLALGDEPVDQFASFKEQAMSRKSTALEKVRGSNEAGSQNINKMAAVASRSANPPPTQMSGAAMPDENAVNSARQKAKAAGSLNELREVLADFKGCNLHLSAKNMVFADGNPEADIMLIGEAPGRDEDIHGLPFVGRSGRLLDSMLAAIKLDRENTYLTNIIPWRPPGNRTPTVQEIEICRPFVERHIELVNPKMIILLGGATAKILLNSTQGIVKLRGRWKTYEMADRQIDAITMFHPANLLDHPAQKKMAWQDLLKIKQKLLELQ